MDAATEDWMPEQSEAALWRPLPGQIALVEPVNAAPGRECLTGIAVPSANGILIDLGASPRPEEPTSDVVVSFFAPDALYRMSGRASMRDDGLLALDVAEAERVQRRTAPRARVALPVRLGASSIGPVAGETLDLSTGGCRVATAAPWPEDLDPLVSVELPGGEHLTTPARVVTVDQSGGRWEYRLAFPGMGDDARDRIARIVALEG